MAVEACQKLSWQATVNSQDLVLSTELAFLLRPRGRERKGISSQAANMIMLTCSEMKEAQICVDDRLLPDC